MDEDVDFSRLFETPISSDLAKVGIFNEADVKFRKVANGRMLRSLARLYPSAANSDYFPVLSVNAPRTRFRKDSASTLLGLTVHSIPVLELLGISGTLEVNGTISEPQHFARGGLTARARNLVDIYSGNVDLNTPYLEDAEVLFNIKALGCPSSWSVVDERVIAKSLKFVAENTLAFLSAEEQENFILDENFLNCDTLPRAIVIIYDFIRAAALRDEKQIMHTSSIWFSDPDVRMNEALLSLFDPMVLGWWQVIVANKGDSAELKRLESTYGQELKGGEQFSHLSSVILAWADE